jgi:hypothetical protein
MLQSTFINILNVLYQIYNYFHGGIMALSENAQIFGVVIAAIAAAGAWASAKRTQKNVLAQIVLQLTEIYSSEEMSSSIANIVNWKNIYKADAI